MSDKLSPMDFARVVSAKKLRGSGLSLGDVVMVVGTKEVPASSKDPYLTRMLIYVVSMKDDLPQVPKEENDNIAYLVDPRSLEKLEGDDVERYNTAIEAKYSGG